MLLDAGGSRTRGAREGGFQRRRWDSGEDIVSPYLWSRGIKKLDVVALTHAHPDQLGGLYAVLENFRVGEFWHAPQAETPAYAALLEKVAERGIPTRTLMAGDALSLGGASIGVLWPGQDPDNVTPGFRPARAALKAGATSASSRNDASLVMRVSAGGMNFLLPGDAGRNEEKGILASGESLESQVLKVAHHGSKSYTSRKFLARVAPRVAIFSSEAGGGGGDLPNSETLEAPENAGARIFRTDTDGATTVEGKDGVLVVRTYRGSEAVVMTGEGGHVVESKHPSPAKRDNVSSRR
jgi:competence protein ComEC